MELDSPKALHACNSCKKQKRKCDKSLPNCSLCVRVGRVCDYSEPAPPTQEDLSTLQMRIAELENRLNSSNASQHSATASPGSSASASSIKIGSLTARVVTATPFEAFPTLFFLDYDIFNEARKPIPKPSPPVPDEIYSILGTIENIHHIATQYFSTIHPWLPIVSKKRLELALNNPDTDLSPELALLLVAMHLITDEHRISTLNAQSGLYWNVKSYYSVLESHAVMTHQLLQANVLITAYEIGHAIYPAAYLSVGRCATLGKALGFDHRKYAPQMLRRPGAFAEVEEIRRTWWAVMLFDRYVNLGIPGHALATEEPSMQEILPADDSLWDEGEMSGSEPLYITSPTNLRAGAFARTCQASHLLGKDDHLMTDNLKGSETRWETGLQVFRTLKAFQNVLAEEFANSPQNFGTALALTLGSILRLCDPYSCTETNRGPHTVEEAEMQRVSIGTMKETAADILNLSRHLQMSMTANPGAMSPLVADAIYMAGTTYMWMVHEIGSADAIAGYRALRDILHLIDSRWAVGKGYLKALDKAKEVLYGNNQLL